ncbi:XrtA/PEP-CTERM system TPR-repeat protein PrsT [Psychrosphaera aestuarii]|uniref:XrtA/PEP-CTERM system TPR-repeat protein PrsT n=1 Tax=Psychrosphaera aestuarii TaxID=1266052 RepID=UPI001B341BFB|nr:XrtA/PEP-CTERM system TPR-repeat protein PrsT [Psychrosphaera aestuarii]
MNLSKSILTTSVALALVGCGKNSPEESIIAGKSFLQNNDYDAAIIEFKNAIKDAPNDSNARLILADLYLKRGFLDAAEKELNVSLQNGAPEQAVFPNLVRVLYLQNDYQQITEIDVTVDVDLNTFSELETIQFNTFRGIAFDKLNQPEGLEILKSVVESNDNSPFVALAHAYITFKENEANKQYDFSESINILDNVITQNPDFTDGILLRGYLYSASNNYEAALKDFKTHLELMPNANFIRFHLAHSYLRLDQNNKALEQADIILKLVPNHPYANEVKGVALFREGNFESAQLYMEKAIQSGEDNDTNRTVAGLSAYQLNNYNQALNHLEKLSKKLDGTHPGKRALLLAQIKLGHNDAASQALSDISGSVEPELLSQITYEFIKAGNEAGASEAIELLERSLAKLEQEDVSSDLKRQLGTFKLSLSDISGLEDLEEAVTLAPDSDLTRSNLAAAYLQSGEYQKALDVAQAWLKDKPESASAYSLMGISQLAMGNKQQGNSNLERALELDKSNIAAQMYAASKAADAGNYNKATNIVRNVLAMQPQYFPAVELYYSLAMNSEDAQLSGVIEHIETTISNANNQALTIFLAKIYSQQKEYEKALSVLDKVTSKSAEFWQMKTRLLILTNNIKQALEVADSWIKASPNKPVSWANKLQITETLGLHKLTIETAEKALALFPDNSLFLLFKAYHAINTGKIKLAESVMENVTDDIRTSGMGLRVTGQIIAMKGNYSDSLPILLESYEKWDSNGTAAIIYITYTKDKNTDKGITFLEQHVESKPNDANATFILANHFIYLDKVKALKYYSKLLTLNDKNLVALNNVAYLYTEQGKHKEALSFALKAAEIAPNNSQVIDTIANIYLSLKQKDNAKEWIEKGLVIAPDHAGLLEKKLIVSQMN